MYRVFLATLLVSTILGVEIFTGDLAYPARARDLAQLSPRWVRTEVHLNQVSPRPGVYNWKVLDGFTRDLQGISNAGADAIVAIKSAPRWMRSDPRPCGIPDNLAGFAEVVQEIVKRYPQVEVWEIGNEPDSASGVWKPNGAVYYGCWGDPSKAGYGGAEYAKVINAVYNVIHTASPGAMVAFGGLMLPCLNCPQAGYFEAAVEAGAVFDMVSFHFYVEPWMALPTALDALEQRVNMMRGLTDKPLILTETNALCDVDCDKANDERQARWLRLVKAWNVELVGIIVYSYKHSGWRDAGVIGKDGRKRAIWYEFTKR